MAFQRESSRNGYVRLWFRSGDCTDVRLADWQAVCDAAEMGLEWVPCVDLYGDPHHVRMTEVQSFGQCTAQSLDAYYAEEDAKAEYDRLHGNTE